MITRSQVQTVAKRSRFRLEPVEKVLRLIEILRRLDQHEATSSAWVLKGGTALNLFHLDAPRLSVDVGINFVGVEDARALPRARESFERALVSVGGGRPLVVGDRLDTDIAGAVRLGWDSALVLTGDARREDVQSSPWKPTFIVDDLSGLV